MLSSSEYYDRFSPTYASYAQNRRPYINAINNLISCPTHKPSYLDIGCGDGLRTALIAQKLGAPTITILDESPQMLQKAKRSLHALKVRTINESIVTKPDWLTEKFDIITCLWNVFGHLPQAQDRQQALHTIFKLLKPDGIFYCDVNNRYNISAYGRNAIKNILTSPIPTTKKGDYSIALPGSEDKTCVHLFKPGELDILLRTAGFTKISRNYVNYNSGKMERTWLSGQLLYEARI